MSVFGVKLKHRKSVIRVMPKSIGALGETLAIM